MGEIPSAENARLQMCNIAFRSAAVAHRTNDRGIPPIVAVHSMEAEGPAPKRRKLTKDEIEHPLTGGEAELGSHQHAHTINAPKR